MMHQVHNIRNDTLRLTMSRRGCLNRISNTTKYTRRSSPPSCLRFSDPHRRRLSYQLHPRPSSIAHTTFVHRCHRPSLFAVPKSRHLKLVSTSRRRRSVWGNPTVGKQAPRYLHDCLHAYQDQTSFRLLPCVAAGDDDGAGPGDN